MTKRVILVTGASAGIGRRCAELLQTRGHRVYGASRNIAQLDEVPFERVTMNVDDWASVCTEIASIVRIEKRIDAVVNAAGFGIAGPVEVTPVDQVKRQFETNFFGTLRVCQAVLPHMRKQSGGVIVNLSSLGGLTAIPFQAFYTATKFAIEGFTEGLRLEVAPFGIRVHLVEPGDFKTEFTARRERIGDPEPLAPYEPRCTTALNVMERDEQSGADPIQVAQRIVRLIEVPTKKFRHPVGPLPQRLTVRLKQFIPYSLYELLIRSYYGLV